MSAADSKGEAIVTNAIGLLKAVPGIGWKLVHRQERRTNLYVTKGHQTESALSGYRDTVHVTVYKRFGDKLGECSFPLISADKREMSKRVADALVICGHTQKQAYSLPERRPVPNIPLADPEIVNAISKGMLDKKLLAIAERVKEEFAHRQGFRLNSMELFAAHGRTMIINSTGLKASAEDTEAYLEMTITAFVGEKEQEHVPATRVRRLRDLDIKQLVDEYTKIAHDVLIAFRPNRFKGPAVLVKDALREFFAPSQYPNPIVAHCSARWKHMGISRYQTDEYITNRPIIGDKITLVSNPLVPYNADSEAFDDDGVPGQQVTLIKDGRFREHIANKKYADYLGIRPSGPLGVIQVKPGSKSMAQLLSSKKMVYEIVAFSSFVPNDVSGDFTAEIRLGYMHDGDRKVPFKGGMLTGNIFDLMSNAYFSKEVEKMPGYIGPEAIRFENAVVSGM